MGLSQKIHFQHVDQDEVENFINRFCESIDCEKKDNLFILSSAGDNGYRIELAVENYGLYIHRSGNYFEIFGMLLEEITENFGKTTIEDY